MNTLLNRIGITLHINLFSMFRLFLLLQFLHVLQGLFQVRGEDGQISCGAPSDTIIKKGVFYEITNKGKKTGIIQFEYGE